MWVNLEITNESHTPSTRGKKKTHKFEHEITLSAWDTYKQNQESNNKTKQQRSESGSDHSGKNTLKTLTWRDDFLLDAARDEEINLKRRKEKSVWNYKASHLHNTLQLKATRVQYVHLNVISVFDINRGKQARTNTPDYLHVSLHCISGWRAAKWVFFPTH